MEVFELSPHETRGGEQLHNTRVRQFAVTVYGEIDVEASDGTGRICGPAT